MVRTPRTSGWFPHCRGHVGDVAHAPEDLDGLVGGEGRGLGRAKLGHGRVLGVGEARVFPGSGAPREEARGLELAGHLGDLELDGVQIRQRLAEGRAVRRVGRGDVERRLADAQRLGSKRVIQRRFNVSVPRARVPEKAPTRRDRSER